MGSRTTRLIAKPRVIRWITVVALIGVYVFSYIKTVSKLYYIFTKTGRFEFVRKS